MTLAIKVRRIISSLKKKIRHSLLYLRKSDYSAKVFCIGYNKTGTTSLGAALSMLGYNHSSFNRRVYRNYYLKGRINKVLWYTSKFKSFDDLPWLKEDMIPLLDKYFPESKFIYLYRDEEDWKQSFVSYTFKKKGLKADIDEAIKKYREHREFVFNYFKDFSNDRFLVLDIKDAEGPAKLGRFLNKVVNFEKFPHKNKTADYIGNKF